MAHFKRRLNCLGPWATYETQNENNYAYLNFFDSFKVLTLYPLVGYNATICQIASVSVRWGEQNASLASLCILQQNIGPASQLVKNLVVVVER